MAPIAAIVRVFPSKVHIPVLSRGESQLCSTCSVCIGYIWTSALPVVNEIILANGPHIYLMYIDWIRFPGEIESSRVYGAVYI